MTSCSAPTLERGLRPGARRPRRIEIDMTKRVVADRLYGQLSRESFGYLNGRQVDEVEYILHLLVSKKKGHF